MSGNGIRRRAGAVCGPPDVGYEFSKNGNGKSLVVHHKIADDGLVVLTRFGEKSIKDWAVAHVSIRNDRFYHRSEATFFTLQGTLKHFCELTCESYEESIDDFAG